MTAFQAVVQALAALRNDHLWACNGQWAGSAQKQFGTRTSGWRWVEAGNVQHQYNWD